MKLIHLALLASASLTACSGPGRTKSAAPLTTGPAVTDPRAQRVVAQWRIDVDTLAAAVARLDSAVATLSTPTDVARARQAFSDARTAFKRVEIGLEYYTPSTARSMNGPALPEVEETEGPEAVLAPTGFQVIEEALFGDDALAEHESLQQEVRTLQQLVTRARTMLAPQQTTDAHVWDAAKLELARIATLGITGFDSPVAGHSLAEADAALDGVARALAPYRTTTVAFARLDDRLRGARAMLRATADRERFDHLAFLAARATPLAHALRDARVALGISLPTERRAFRVAAASVFDADAFDVMAFAPLDARPATDAQVALGQMLFNDTRLSDDGRRACTSCHLPERAFTDGQRVNRARGGAPLARNTPTVINSGLQLGMFSDLRTTYLEDQVTDVVENVDEMHGSLSRIAVRLGQDAAMAGRFRAAFVAGAGSGDTVVTAARIRTALAAYQRSLSRLDAPADRALRGDTLALAPEARRGFNVFVGKGKCATCHFLPLTNGTVPPMYQKSEVEVLGTPQRAATRGASVDPDPGRFRLTRAAPHQYAFRTPSLRNVALTAPYMHNGAYATLEQVIDFYNRGGGAGIGVRLAHQTLPPDPLHLSPAEQRQLLAFLQALTDTAGTTRR